MGRLLRAWLRRLFGLFSGPSADREFDAEIESHLQMHIDDNVRSGMTLAEARRIALIALGGLAQTREGYRDRRGVPALESVGRDLRHGLRTLLRTPAFTIAAIVILGLGIGVNSAIFTLVNAVVLRPLPFADADRIMRLWHTPPPTLFAGESTFPLSAANFLDWEAQNTVFDRMAIYRVGRQSLIGDGEPIAVVTIRASADFLPILGISTVRGHGFSQADDLEGGPRTVLLSQGFFETKFGGDPHLIGKTINLNHVAYEVIGIVPEAQAFINGAEAWIPLAWTPKERAVRGNHNYRAIAKLKAGVTVAQAQQELTEISKRLEARYPDDNKDWGALVRPLQDDMVGDARKSLFLLLGAVGLVLLIACANLANLMLVRTYARAREIAVRIALGASRRRVIQHVLSEGLVLGLGGGAAGFAAAYFCVKSLTAAFGNALPRAAEVHIDGSVLGFTAAIAMAAGLCTAVASAWKLTSGHPGDALKTGPGRGNSSTGFGALRRALVVSEVALALMLLVGAGLLIRSLNGLRAVDPGFNPRNLLTATVDIPPAKYPTEDQRNLFFAHVLERVRTVPGVEDAAWIDTPPLRGGSSQYVQAEGMPQMRESEMPVVAVRQVSPGYFGTARIQMLAGRDVARSDGLRSPRVVVISERTAKRFWPGENPLGKHLTLLMMTKEAAEVVGVVREVKLGALEASEADSETAVYVPAAQFALNSSTLVVRTSVPPRGLSQSVVSAVRTVDPQQPVLNILTMDEIVENALGQRPIAMLLLASFAGLAVLLALVGIYSVLAYVVRQRVREIGIRLALGAPVGGVLRLVLLEGLKPTAIGIVLGLVLSALFTRVMTALLFGVGRYDPATFGTVAVLMVGVGIAATLIPAYRATRVDPIETLRAE